MNQLRFTDKITKEELLCLTKTLHTTTPAIHYGAINFLSGLRLQDKEQWDEFMDKLCTRIRKKWEGVQNISLILSPGSDENRNITFTAGLSTNVYSLSLYILDYFVEKVNKLKTEQKPSLESSGEDDCQDDSISSDLIQINASAEEVENWIESFIMGKRELINVQNINNFCTTVNKQNCARVDAVLVKRKDVISHVGVENTKNTWGPLLGRSPDVCENHKASTKCPSQNIKLNEEKLASVELGPQTSKDLYSYPMSKNSKKRIFSAIDINMHLDGITKKLKSEKNDSDSG